ncbi:MAG: hypothetical protein OXC07_13190 [Kistimonas sp.]|nr:hypothetical protein [Kistimonas sp.]
MNIPEELGKKRSARKIFSQTSLEDLTKILKNLHQIEQEKQEELRVAEQQNQARQENVRHILELMQKQNVSVEDLKADWKGNKGGTGRKRQLPHYRFTFHRNDGQPDSWDGPLIGQLPTEFRMFLERTGKKRADCIERELQ